MLRVYDRLGVPGSLVGVVRHAMRPPDFIRFVLGRRGSMRPATRVSTAAPETPTTQPLSGLARDHPLSVAIEAVADTRRQCTHVAAILVGATIARLQGAHWSGPLAVSAGVVLAVLGVMLAFRVQDRHDRVIAFILDGHEDAGPAIVQRARDRLLSPRNRSKLSASLASVAEDATKLSRRSLRPTPPLFTRRIIIAVADMLVEVCSLLEEGPARARGVARVDRLLRVAASPLYGDDLTALREELTVIREQLVCSSS